MKNNLVLIALVAVMMTLGIGSAVAIKSASSASKACKPGVGQSYQVMIMDNKAYSADVTAKRCDSITFMNHDDTNRAVLITSDSGQMDNSGTNKKTLAQDETFTYDLDRAGNYSWQDQNAAQIKGTVTVTQ